MMGVLQIVIQRYVKAHKAGSFVIYPQLNSILWTIPVIRSQWIHVMTLKQSKS